MKIEKFSSQEKTGYKIIGATFASSKNINGAHFDPVEVFAGEKSEKFNLGHKDYTTDYSTGTVVTKYPEAKIEGKLLRFTWDIETTNENFIALIEAEKFGGFSPELEPKQKPVLGKQIGTDKNGKPIYERFYRSGDLEWINTAILAKNQKPGFVGANEFELEKFEAIEESDVVIAKEDLSPTDSKPKANPENIEKFALKEDLEYQLMYVKKELDEYKQKMMDLETSISALTNPGTQSEDFAALQDENTELKAKLKQTQTNTQPISKLPENIEVFSKNGSVENQNSQEIEKTKQSLINKIL